MRAPSDPRISVVMVDGSFRERFHLLDALAAQTFPSDDFEVLWVEYYETLRPALRKKLDTRSNFRPLLLKRDGVYHSSFCFNAGIRAARGRLIVVPDADVVVAPDFLETVWREHESNDKLVMYLFRLDEPKKAHCGRVDLEHLRKTCTLRNPSNYGGCLSVRKQWLMRINGYEQHPAFGTGHHANGLDLYTRFKNAGLHVMWHPELKLYHPWHPLTTTWGRGYRLQTTIINYRARHKEILPFQGLDPTLDRAIPADLQARLDSAGRFGRGWTNRVYSKLKSWLG